MEFKPLSNQSRIIEVDALRGFALFGVLLANLPFSGGESMVTNYDTLLTFFYYFLISKKFIAIFSILFGFGFSIQMKRAAAKKVNFTKYFVIRMLLLFVIGSLHTYILWNGDIIRAYAMGGIFLLLIRKLSLKRLITLALLFNVLLTGFIFIGNSALGWQIYDYDYALATEQLVTPSYLRYILINAITDPWTNFFQDMPITLAFTFGNMLIGFILGKIDFFLLPEKLKKQNTWLIVLGTTVGLASSYVYYNVATGALELDLPLLWLPFVVVAGMLLQSLAYMAVFLRLYQTGVFGKLLQFFIPVGKTALSNYIFQSIFYLFVLFHCTNGFQLFGKITMPETYLLGVLFFVFQTMLSYFWLKIQAQGPLEYIWKKLSYGMAKQYKK